MTFIYLVYIGRVVKKWGLFGEDFLHRPATERWPADPDSSGEFDDDKEPE
jgi:hypothetical protein